MFKSKKAKNNHHVVGIIPARMASSRFPGKPLAEIQGVPMIGHVYFRSKMSDVLDEVYVATCDDEISRYIERMGGKAVMTSNKHKRASDRTAEAMLKIEKITGRRIDIAVMIQGDEPMLHPRMIDEALGPLFEDDEILITNLMGAIMTPAEFDDPNVVKVVVDNLNDALYFSREPIPSRKKCEAKPPMYKQICVVPFRRDFLIKYNSMRPTILERVESVDMLRILENGLKIRMVSTKYSTKSVDTKEDLRVVSNLMKNDSLQKKYRKQIS